MKSESTGRTQVWVKHPELLWDLCNVVEIKDSVFALVSVSTGDSLEVTFIVPHYLASI